MAAKFEIKGSSDSQYYFNLKAGNGQVILTSELYKAKAKAENAIRSVQKNAPTASRFEARTSRKRQPYFVLLAANGEIIGTSEMYSSKPAMRNGIESVRRNAASARIVDLSRRK